MNSCIQYFIIIPGSTTNSFGTLFLYGSYILPMDIVYFIYIIVWGADKIFSKAHSSVEYLISILNFDNMKWSVCGIRVVTGYGFCILSLLATVCCYSFLLLLLMLLFLCFSVLCLWHNNDLCIRCVCIASLNRNRMVYGILYLNKQKCVGFSCLFLWP